MISDSLKSCISWDVSFQLTELAKELEKQGLYCILDRKLACILVWAKANQEGKLPLVIVHADYDGAGAPFISYNAPVKEDEETITIWQRGSILYKACHIKTLVDKSWGNPKV